MNLDAFIREVVGPGVPHAVAEVCVYNTVGALAHIDLNS